MNVLDVKFSDLIVSSGESVVDGYRVFAGNSSVNEIPEVYLSCRVAEEVFRRTGRYTRPEFSYRAMAESFDQVVPEELTPLFGGWRGDFAVYSGNQPYAVVEFKVLDRVGKVASLARDVEKLKRFREKHPVDCYVAVMVTDTTRENVDHIRSVAEALVGKFDAASALRVATTGNKLWKWQFCCTELRFQNSGEPSSSTPSHESGI